MNHIYTQMSSENARASYYASLPLYYKLEELRTMIIKPDPDSAKIIKYIQDNRISVNSYVKGVRPNEWIPVLHLCCRYETLQSVVKYLIKCSANIQLEPDADDKEPLLLSCDMSYLRYLIEHGCSLNNLSPSVIKRKLRCADLKRLKILVKTGKLTVLQVLSADPDPILYSLMSMKDYLMYAFNIRQDIKNLTEELRCTIAKFNEFIKQLIIWGASVTDKCLAFCVEHYLFEFLELPEFSKSSGLNPIYHEYKDKLQVAILRPLLNDSRYELTCKVLKQEPCKELYATLNI